MTKQNELKPCPDTTCGSSNVSISGSNNDMATCYTCGITKKVEKWQSRPAEQKLRGDAVLQARQDIIDNVVVPKASKVRQEYYKAAIRHAIINLEAFAAKIERGDV